MGTDRWAAGLGPRPSPRTTVLTVVRPRRLFCEVFLPALEGPALTGFKPRERRGNVARGASGARTRTGPSGKDSLFGACHQSRCHQSRHQSRQRRVAEGFQVDFSGKSGFSGRCPLLSIDSGRRIAYGFSNNRPRGAAMTKKTLCNPPTRPQVGPPCRAGRKSPPTSSATRAPRVVGSSRAGCPSAGTGAIAAACMPIQPNSTPGGRSESRGRRWKSNPRLGGV